MTFDSLGGSHKAVGDNLKRWLEFEARDKLQKEVTSEPTYVEARVPQQNNFSDCGVFVIHFLWCILNDTDKVLQFIGVSCQGCFAGRLLTTQKPVPYAREREEKIEYEAEMNRVWHEATTKELRANWIETIHQLNDRWRAMQGLSDSHAVAPLPSVEDSQASVVQVYPPDRPDTLPTVGEATEGPATESKSSSSESSSSSSATPSDAGPPRPLASEPMSRGASKGVPADAAGAECSDPPSPVLEPVLHNPTSLLSDSESEGGPSRGPSRLRSTSTKVSSREEVDGHVLVEDSQAKSRESSGAPSVLFSSGRPGVEDGAAVPDTLPNAPDGADAPGGADAPDGAHVPDSSEDERRIDLSGVSSAVVPRLAPAKSKRNSSAFGSSPPRSSPPTSPSRRPKRARAGRKSAPDGYTQQTLAAYRVNGAHDEAQRPAAATPGPTPATAAATPEPDPRPEPRTRAPNHTYRDKGKKRAVSGPATGGSEPKRTRSNNGRPAPAGQQEQGGSSHNPIDIDPSDSE